jgi:hypothetical protein
MRTTIKIPVTHVELLRQIKRWCNTDDRKWLFMAELVAIKGTPTDSDGDIWAINNLVFDAVYDYRAMQWAFRIAKAKIKDYEAGTYKPDTAVI